VTAVKTIMGFALASVAGYVAVEYAKASGILDPLLPSQSSEVRTI